MTREEALNKAINIVAYFEAHFAKSKEAREEATNIIEALEQEPKTGHWRHYEGMLICSECGSEFYDDIMEYCGDDVPKCCPDCGAKMKEVIE